MMMPSQSFLGRMDAIFYPFFGCRSWAWLGRIWAKSQFGNKKAPRIIPKCLFYLGWLTGLEPATTGITI